MSTPTTWQGKRVAVLGLGRSGQGAAALLHEHGATVIAVDDRAAAEFADLRERLSGQIADWALEGSLPRPQELDAVVVSPGVPRDHPCIVAASGHGVSVIGELELAAAFVQGPIVAVTGTNGKSTTVSLVAAMLKANGRPAHLLGNIGRALSAEVSTVGREDVVVIEVSSFQLEWVDRFHPRAAAVLNVAPDHLNRYDSFEDYAEAKRRILNNLGRGDIFVHPSGDARVAGWAEESAATSWSFGRDLPPQTRAVTTYQGQVVRRDDGGTTFILPLDDIPLLGEHNLMNVLAALALVSPFGLDDERCARAIREFRPLDHRAVDVATTDGVRWIDDSKATNVHAAMATATGLKGLDTWLLGGSGKGEDYSPLRQAARLVRRVICFGAEAAPIAEALEGCTRVDRANGLGEALEMAGEEATAGAVVLLSPACASFDEFSSFEERGEFFASWVRRNRGGDR